MHAGIRTWGSIRLAGLCFALWPCAVLTPASSPGTEVVIMLDMNMGDTERGPIVRTLAAALELLLRN